MKPGVEASGEGPAIALPRAPAAAPRSMASWRPGRKRGSEAHLSAPACVKALPLVALVARGDKKQPTGLAENQRVLSTPLFCLFRGRTIPSAVLLPAGMGEGVLG